MKGQWSISAGTKRSLSIRSIGPKGRAAPDSVEHASRDLNVVRIVPCERNRQNSSSARPAEIVPHRRRMPRLRFETSLAARTPQTEHGESRIRTYPTNRRNMVVYRTVESSGLGGGRRRFFGRRRWAKTFLWTTSRRVSLAKPMESNGLEAEVKSCVTRCVTDAELASITQLLREALSGEQVRTLIRGLLS